MKKYNKKDIQYDTFENEKFSLQEWSAKYLSSYDDIKRELDNLNLIGRKIKNIKILGMDYLHREDAIENFIYPAEYDKIPPHFKFIRVIEIDEPILIEFENGDVLEVLAEIEPEFRISMNKIPFDTKAGINKNNMIANVIFSNCIDKRISNIEIDTCESFNSNTEKNCVIVIRLENGDCLKIYHDCHDYCTVENCNIKGEVISIYFKDLKKGLIEED